MVLNIVMLGSGNVATHLSAALINSGHKIIQVYSRKFKNAKELAEKCNAIPINKVSKLDNDSDLYIIAISDKAIGELVSTIDFTNKNVVHTAGSVSLNIFPKSIVQYGVFYPFQTFSKKRDVQFSDIPICIEANTAKFEEFLISIASQLSGNVQKINSTQRKHIHLTGVFACNFVNHLYYIACNILSKNNIDEKILNPLIRETSAKINELSPFEAQTGPAIRNDKESIKKHLDLLSSSPEYQQIYSLLSDDIYKTH